MTKKLTELTKKKIDLNDNQDYQEYLNWQKNFFKEAKRNSGEISIHVIQEYFIKKKKYIEELIKNGAI